jgi:peptidoglycan/xylan/chitin deacetylase (PgdA/CDA1 family)
MVTAVLMASLIGLPLYGYIFPTAQVFGKVYYQAKTPEKMVALTFDDGPNEPYTSQILDLLEQYDVKATFFVVGKNVELYPDTAKRIADEGHVLGNHTYKHNANHALIDDGGAEIKRAQVAIRTVSGVEPHLYRPPHGKKSPWEAEYLKEQNLVEVTWSVQANEAHRELVFDKPVPEEVANDILKQVKPGKIILMHDGYGTNHNDVKSDKSLTVKALPLIIEELQSQGYSFVTVSELLNIPAYNH